MESSKAAYHHGSLQETLLASAIESLERVGPDHLSLRELARSAGVSPNAPYRHFATKEDLLQSLVERGFDELAEELQKATSLGDRELEAMGQAYTAFSQKRPNLFRLMFSGLAQGNKGKEVKAMVLLGEAVSRRLPSEADQAQVTKVALAAWCLVHGAAVLQLESLLDWATDDLFSMDQLRESLAALTSPAPSPAKEDTK